TLTINSNTANIKLVTGSVTNDGTIYLNDGSTSRTATLQLSDGATLTNSGIMQLTGSAGTFTLTGTALGSVETVAGTAIDLNGMTLSVQDIAFTVPVNLVSGSRITLLDNDCSFA